MFEKMKEEVRSKNRFFKFKEFNLLNAICVTYELTRYYNSINICQHLLFYLDSKFYFKALLLVLLKRITVNIVYGHRW